MSGAVESFGPKHTAPTRLRLTPSEQGHLRYVLSDWGGDAGLASNFGSMVAQLASAPRLVPQESRRAIDAPPVDVSPRLAESGQAPRLEPGQEPHGGLIHVRHVTPSYHDRELPQEAWSNRRRYDDLGNESRAYRLREARLRCWRALSAMATGTSLSLTVLHLLYGDRPPGLPEGVLWDKSVNAEYVRVVRLVDASGGTTGALETKLRVERKARPGETGEGAARRVEAANAARASLLRDLAKECEALIVRACGDYRVAHRSVA